MFFKFLKNVGIQEDVYIEAVKYHKINKNLKNLDFIDDVDVDGFDKI